MHTLILGLDAFDPGVFERLSGQGRLPNLTRHAEAGGYARFGIANPPQSEVSWTSIATGLDPGGHGIFDFVHRDPASYAPYLSLLPTERKLGGTHFASPTTARTIFEHVVDLGYPATSLWWPATFPARPGSPVRTLPGLGTPDLLGRWGIGTMLSSDADRPDSVRKTEFAHLKPAGDGRYVGEVRGPVRKTRGGERESTIEIQIEPGPDETARVSVDGNALDLRLGEWSPILEVTFKLGLLVSVRAITRLIVTHLEPDVRAYVMPLQIHPLHSPWPYGTPPGFVRAAWKECGPFLTLGWPQDTTALEEGCIDDEQFLTLCRSIFEARERVLMVHLGEFREGLLASVFDSLDRVQHMFWRTRPDLIEGWYEALDAMVGRVEQRLKELGHSGARILIVSDHGFSDFDTKVHLNRWLIDRGYLALRAPSERGGLKDVDWEGSQAYAIGLNSLYLNLAGREGRGSLLEADRDERLGALRDDLSRWSGPDGRGVVLHTWTQSEAFSGPLAPLGPDLVVGFNPGYRASSETGLGEWGGESLTPNRDHWGADHCIDAGSVPGVLFSSQSLAGYESPTYRDFPGLAVGMVPDSKGGSAPRSYAAEDQAVVEERLRSLGYL